uniref:Uncharacterized protein n=1 Tax=Lactuca sativa TaxID=4236 RepID=A0A9R1WBC6_LACSA|nr:hypothetical protein LSAT_V11C300150280 [Lactuca sativa]
MGQDYDIDFGGKVEEHSDNQDVMDVNDRSNFDNDGKSSNDNDFLMDEEDLVVDYEVEMSEFHSMVDTNVEWIEKKKKKKPIDVDNEEEEMEVIDIEKNEFVGYEEDKRARLLKDLTRLKYCLDGKVHGSEFMVGQTFQTKKEVTCLGPTHRKNDKIRVRVVCKGVTPEFNSSGLLGCNKGKGSSVNKQNRFCPWVLLVSRPLDLYIWTVKVYEEKNYFLHTRDVKSCTQSFIAKKNCFTNKDEPYLSNTCFTRGVLDETWCWGFKKQNF